MSRDTPTGLRRLAEQYRRLAQAGTHAERANRLRIAEYLERQAATKERAEGDVPPPEPSKLRSLASGNA